MVEMVKGERLPIQLSGTMSGEPTFRRLIMTGQVRELGGGSISLLLDSGSRHLILFREELGFGSGQRTIFDPSRPRSSDATVDTRMVRSLSFGRSEINNIVVVALGHQKRPDVDGLVPTSLFHSIFISHQGKFVILNPSFPKAPADDVRSGLVAKPLVIPPDFAEMLPPTRR
jgi:hypothetical protein